MKTLFELLSVTGIRRPDASCEVSKVGASSEDCPADGDGDDDGGGSDCPAGT